MVISPEWAAGLDLRGLTVSVVSSLEQELGASDLRWLAAIHRNTAHPHVHLVLAGMRETADGFARVEITKRRLADMKQALALEIERQRYARVPHQQRATPVVAESLGWKRPWHQALRAPASPSVQIRAMSIPFRATASSSAQPTRHLGSVVALRAAARRYQRRMEHETEEQASRLGLDRAA